MLFTPLPLLQTVTPSRIPSSVTYFMDGPLLVIVMLKININKSAKSLCNTYCLRNFLPDCFQNFCILLHSRLIDGNDYYYYTDVTPLKAKNILLPHETLKFNCSNCNNVGCWTVVFS